MSCSDLPDLGPRYRTLSLIAKGGMGAVYLAQQRGADESWSTIAVKTMHAHVDSDEGAAMFLDEARVGMKIAHPNVVRVRATDVVGDRPFILMDYIEGLSFSRLLSRLEARSRRIPIPLVARIVHDVLLGLEAVHTIANDDGTTAGIVHRDVSPQNILVGTDGRARVTDFGVATFFGRVVATAPGELRGKFAYLSPEQVVRSDVDQRADVFSTGILLWEALTGRPLFRGETQAETLANVVREPIAPPSRFRDGIEPALEDVCLRALERDVARRFRSAADFAEALAAATVLGAAEELASMVAELAAMDLVRHRAALDNADDEVPTLACDSVSPISVGSAAQDETPTLACDSVSPISVATPAPAQPVDPSRHATTHRILRRSRGAPWRLAILTAAVLLLVGAFTRAVKPAATAMPVRRAPAGLTSARVTIDTTVRTRAPRRPVGHVVPKPKPKPTAVAVAVPMPALARVPARPEYVPSEL